MQQNRSRAANQQVKKRRKRRAARYAPAALKQKLLGNSLGETVNVRLHIAKADLAFWDETSHSWQTEPGDYTAYVCASAADVRCQLPLQVAPR